MNKNTDSDRDKLGLALLKAAVDNDINTVKQLPYFRARFPSSTDQSTIAKSVKDLRTLPARDLRILKKWYATNDIRELASKILANIGIKKAKLRSGINPNMQGFTESQIKERLGVDTLQGADLSNADLSNAYLHANMSYANLSGANLTESNLSGANLFHADLSDAILDRAKLNGAFLVNAHLEYTHFTGADLTGADFTGTDIRGAWFDNVIGFEPPIEPEPEPEPEPEQSAQERDARERARQLFAARQAQATSQPQMVESSVQLAANRSDCTNTHDPITLEHVNDIPDVDLIKIHVQNDTSDRTVRVDCLDKHALSNTIQNSRVSVIVNEGMQVVNLTIGGIRYYIVKNGLQRLLTANLDGKRVILEPIGRRNIVIEQGTIVSNEMIHQIDIIDIAAYNEMYEFATDMLGLKSGAAATWAREAVKREDNLSFIRSKTRR